MNEQIKSLLNANQFYSNSFIDLTKMQLEDSDLFTNYFEVVNLPTQTFIENYEYDFSPFPVIIGSHIVDVFNDVIAQLSSLIYKSMKLYFEGDSERIATYLNVSPIVVELLLNTTFNTHDIFARHDAIFSDNQLKIIEINSGSTIGGVQHDWIFKAVEFMLSSYKKTSSWNLKYRGVFNSMIKALCESIIELKGKSLSGNIVMLRYYQDEVFVDEIESCLKAVFEENKPPEFSSGCLYFCSDLSEIDFLQSGQVTYLGMEIDSFLLTASENNKVPSSFLMKLISSSLAKQIVMPDSPVCTIYGNKLLFSLLYEETLLNMLSVQERAFIKKHFPWTVRLQQSQVTWKENTYQLMDLLKEYKNLFVLKKAHSAQGLDVIVGQFCATSDWNEHLNKLEGNLDWIAQEYCIPDKLITVNNSSAEVCEFVWGLFEFHGSYGGSFVRSKYLSNNGGVTNNNGVINSATGAREYLVFEECEFRKKLTI